MKIMKRVNILSYIAILLILSFATNAQTGPITGSLGICPGGSTTLGDVTSGGVWSSSNPTVATVSAGSGIVTAVSSGNAIITYTAISGYVTATVTVNASPTSFPVSGGGAYCSGGPGVLVGLSGSQAGVSYQLFNGAIAIGAPLAGTGSSISFGLQSIAGTYTVSATNTATGCSASMAGSATVTTNALPSAYTVTGGGGFCPGGSGVPVGLNGSDAGINYLLYRGSTLVATLAGTGAAISFGLQTVAGTYTVSAVNAATGCSHSMTGSAGVSVYSLPAPVSGPPAVCAGSTAAFTDATSGGTWSCTNPAVATISISSGVVTGVSPGIAVVSYSLGTGCVVTQAITVNATPSVILGPGFVCAGSFISLTDATPGGAWSSSNPGVAAVGMGGIVTGLSTGAVAITYSVAGCSTATTVTVAPLPTVYSVTGGGGFCLGLPGADVGLNGSDTGVYYQLLNGSSPVGAPLHGTGSALDFGYQAVAGTYFVKATAAYTGCANTMAGSAAVSILPAPASYTVTGGGGYCPGSPGVHIALTGSQVGAAYQLMLGGAPVGAPLSGTGLLLDFGLHTSTGAYSVIAALGACTVSMSGSASVSVYAPPVVFAVTSSGTGYCVGGTGVHVGLTGSQPGTLYRLFDGSTMVDTLTGTGSPLDFGIYATGTYTVTATNNTTGCISNMSGTAFVSSYALPALYSITGGGNYCTGGAGVHVGLSGSGVGISYQLYLGPAMVGTPIPGTGAALDFGLQTTPGIYTAVATNSATGCTNNMTGTGTVSVTPVVVPSVSVSSVPGDTVCAGTAVVFHAAAINGGPAPVFGWSVNGMPAGVTGATYSYVPANGDAVTVSMTSSAPCAIPSIAGHTSAVIVHPYPVITGPTSLCMGTTITLSSTTGTIWTSSSLFVATIATVGSFTGVVTPLSPGTTVISSTMAGCTTTSIVTVNPLPVVSASSATSCGGSSTITAAGAMSYSWAPPSGLSCNTCATTIANPGATTVYTVTGTAGTGCTDTASVRVDENRVYGYISYGSSAYDTFRVFLIQFNATDSSLITKDSALTCMAGGSPYYQFNDVPTGNYMVKARLLGQPAGVSGYIPTYSVSTPYWNTAASVAHSGGSDSLHINMVYGIAPAGPGYIGGYISSGTVSSGFVAAPGVLVLLKDATSNFVLTYTYTDASGNYSFSNIAAGNYIVYPEDFGFHTTPSGLTALNNTVDSVKNIDFRIYTAQRIILPVMANGVAALNSSSAFSVYPNPAAGFINLRWSGLAPGLATLLITDMVGRAVYSSEIRMDDVQGEKSIEPLLNTGLYILIVKSEDVSYCAKLVIAR